MRFVALVVSTVGLVFVMAAASTGAQARQASPVGKTKDDVVGASILHPPAWSVERGRQTFDGTYGFTLWQPEPDPTAHDHGYTPVVRVARAYDLRPSGISSAVRGTLSAYPDLPLESYPVRVGVGKHKGLAVGPIPGSTSSTEVYAPVRGRVYRITVYSSRPGEEDLDAGDRELLSDLRFYKPSRSVESLGLPDGEAAATYYENSRVPTGRGEPTGSRTMLTTSSLNGDVPVYSEKRIEEGCFLAHSTFFFQTQHGPGANSNPDDNIRTGNSIVGKPNYWGEYTHGNLGPGYGRCDEPHNTNDKFAVDYPLDRGDAVYSPFRSGTVTFAGRNTTHQDYGIFVSIKAGNDKYVNISAHLDGLAPGIKRGATVDRNTIIGFAGDTGGPDFPVGRVHLHQAFYRFPDYTPDGAPYGGRGLQAVYFHYWRGEGGIYELGLSHTDTQISKGDDISY